MRKICLILVCAAFIAQSAYANSPENQENAAPGWFSRLWAGTSTSLIHSDMRTHWIITGVGTLGALPFDEQIMQRRSELMSDELAHFGNSWGGFWAAASILPGVYLVDNLRGESSDQQLRNLDYIASTMITVGLTTEILKWTVRRERPNQATRKVSFPSGHTSAAFAFAEAVRNLYGNGPGLVFYSMAVITGVSRVHDNKHHLSDVIAGAGLGIGIARGFFIEHKSRSAVQGQVFQSAHMINFRFVF